jgi:hypothetical protein
MSRHEARRYKSTSRIRNHCVRAVRLWCSFSAGGQTVPILACDGGSREQYDWSERIGTGSHAFIVDLFPTHKLLFSSSTADPRCRVILVSLQRLHYYCVCVLALLHSLLEPGLPIDAAHVRRFHLGHLRSGGSHVDVLHKLVDGAFTALGLSNHLSSPLQICC